MQPNGNYLINWSARGYLSEFTIDGQLVMEAQFTASRFNSYRVYKLPFVGRPTEPPALKTFRHESEEASLTVAYVSWNGATEVATWQFEGTPRDGDVPSCMGTASRTGFETVLTVSGVWSDVRAIAIDADGNILGESAAVNTLSSDSSTATTLATKSNSNAFLRPLGALTQNKTVITISRSSLWFLLFGAVLLSLVFQGVLFAAVHIYRRWTRRTTWTSCPTMADEKEVDLPLLERNDSKDDHTNQKGFKD